MTIETLDSSESFIGDGAIVTFAVTYVVQRESDIVPLLDGVVQSTGFTTTLNPDQETAPGADVVFDVAPALNVVVEINRLVVVDQQVDYQAYDAFPAETHESALDKLTMICQQLTNLPIGTKLLGFNPNGIFPGAWTLLPVGTVVLDTTEVWERTA